MRLFIFFYFIYGMYKHFCAAFKCVEDISLENTVLPQVFHYATIWNEEL